ncbi:MAG: hypothetical protein FJZ47_21195 [Candidatus Tectomicrobia bacterium]|uniref:Uncharacterized protein n=1 Tax=Tectimicrobiota bacterium TaxID=2528274 RepID=A0A938B633_UNCTE|nr:hypothetical protein [Candidatus Tectomicrobia bacterium]
MSTLSQGAFTAWQLAAGEAMRTRQSQIEAEMLFIGICKLGTWLRTMKQRGKIVPNGLQDLRGLFAEAETVETALQTFAIPPISLYKAVRTALGQGTHVQVKKQVVHRSQACKMAFQRGEKLAAASPAGEVHCLHLLTALLDPPGPVLPRVVQLFDVDIAALHARLVTITTVLDTRHGNREAQGEGVSHIIYVGT